MITAVHGVPCFPTIAVAGDHFSTTPRGSIIWWLSFCSVSRHSGGGTSTVAPVGASLRYIGAVSVPKLLPAGLE